MERIYLGIRSNNKKHIRGYILDISYNGIGIASTSRIRNGSDVEVVIDRAEPVILKGTVVSVLTRKRKTYRYRLGVKLKASSNIKQSSLGKLFLNKNKRKSARFPLSISWKQD